MIVQSSRELLSDLNPKRMTLFKTHISLLFLLAELATNAVSERRELVGVPVSVPHEGGGVLHGNCHPIVFKRW